MSSLVRHAARAVELARTPCHRRQSQVARLYAAPSATKISLRPECFHPLSSTIIASHETKGDGIQTSNAPCYPGAWSCAHQCRIGPYSSALPHHRSTSAQARPPERRLPPHCSLQPSSWMEREEKRVIVCRHDGFVLDEGEEARQRCLLLSRVEGRRWIHG